MITKWDELTTEEQNLLVSEKVMGFEPGQECEGYMGEQPNSSDGWFCQKCGYEGYWGDSFTHEEKAPRYAESMDLALTILERYERVVMGHDNKNRGWLCVVYREAFVGQAVHEELAEAICLATLMVEGRIKGEIYTEYTAYLTKS